MHPYIHNKIEACWVIKYFVCEIDTPWEREAEREEEVRKERRKRI